MTGQRQSRLGRASQLAARERPSSPSSLRRLKPHASRKTQAACPAQQQPAPPDRIRAAGGARSHDPLRERAPARRTPDHPPFVRDRAENERDSAPGAGAGDDDLGLARDGQVDGDRDGDRRGVDDGAAVADGRRQEGRRRLGRPLGDRRQGRGRRQERRERDGAGQRRDGLRVLREEEGAKGRSVSTGRLGTEAAPTDQQQARGGRRPEGRARAERTHASHRGGIRAGTALPRRRGGRGGGGQGCRCVCEGGRDGGRQGREITGLKEGNEDGSGGRAHGRIGAGGRRRRGACWAIETGQE